MSERITTRMIELRIEWLNKALGRPLTPFTGQAPNCKPTDAFYADNTPCYGGWRIECLGSTPFGSTRVTKAELCRQLDAILASIELGKRLVSGPAKDVIPDLERFARTQGDGPENRMRALQAAIA